MDSSASGQAAAELTAADHATVAANLKLATGGAAPHHAWRMMEELAAAAGPGELEAAAAAGDVPEAGESAVLAAIEAAMALARTAARLMNLFVRQTEALDRRARRLGRGAETADGAAAEEEPDGAEILARLIDAYRADLRRMDEEKGAACAEGDGQRSGASKAGGRDPDPGGGSGP